MKTRRGWNILLKFTIQMERNQWRSKSVKKNAWSHNGNTLSRFIYHTSTALKMAVNKLMASFTAIRNHNTREQGRKWEISDFLASGKHLFLLYTPEFRVAVYTFTVKQGKRLVHKTLLLHYTTLFLKYWNSHLPPNLN